MTSRPEATEPDAEPDTTPLRVTVIPLAVPAAGGLEPPVPIAVVAPSAHPGDETAATVDEPPEAGTLGVGQLSEKRPRQRLRDPWSYAGVGTFIAVFATVFDVLLDTLGTANTKLLVAEVIAAACGILLVIASAVILRPRERRPPREPA